MNKNYIYIDSKNKLASITFLLILISGILLTPIFISAQNENPENILKKVADDVYMLKEMTIDLAEGTVTIPCKINMNEGLIEVVLCRKEGKVHESLLVTDISPLEFQTALLLLGLDPVNELPDDNSKVDQQSQLASIETPGDSVYLFVSYDAGGGAMRVPVENLIRNESINNTMIPSTWLFRGAATHQSGHVILEPDVSMIATYHDQMALMELNNNFKFDDELFYVNESARLTVGKQINLIIEKIK